MDYVEAMANWEAKKQKEKEQREIEKSAEYESIISRLINMSKKEGIKEN